MAGLAPDDLRRLLSGVQSDGVLEAIRAADRREGYLHWDDFKHRPSPDGWAPEDLWRLVVLTQRTAPSRSLPLLRQKGGAPFRIVRTDPLLAALGRIDRRERLWAALGKASSTDGDVGHRLMAQIDEAHHSSAIEGAVTTRQRSIELIRSGQEPKDRAERMVLNNFEAVRRLDEWRQRPLTPELLCEMQATVTAGTLDDPADVGRLRTDDEVRIVDAVTSEVVHEPPPCSELGQRIEDLCTFANEVSGDEAPGDEDSLHPLMRAVLLHHQLAYDHPFGDGNGRTGRTLFLWSALRAGYSWLGSLSLSRSIHRAREQYYRSFRYVESDRGDATYFVRSQLRFLEQEIEILARYLERLAGLERWLSQRNALIDRLNERQLALFEHALEHVDEEFTATEHRAYHGVSQPTAWSDLEGLVAEGLFDFVRRGRKKFYLATPKLRELAAERPPDLRGAP